MKTYKLTKQNVLQRVKDAEQSSLNVIESILKNALLHRAAFSIVG